MKEPLKPCPLDGAHPYGPPEIKELKGVGFLAECVTAQHTVSVSGKTIEEVTEKWNRRAQSPPVAQVEVYRMALEELWAWKESDTVKGWFQMAHIHGSRVSAEYSKKVEDMNDRIKALLTSKPEVAPVRKWEAEDVK